MGLRAEEDTDRTMHRRELGVAGFGPRRHKATRVLDNAN